MCTLQIQPLKLMCILRNTAQNNGLFAVIFPLKFAEARACSVTLPTESNGLCSQHFLDGKRSLDPDSRR